jgi:hypothetical protein
MSASALPGAVASARTPTIPFAGIGKKPQIGEFGVENQSQFA